MLPSNCKYLMNIKNILCLSALALSMGLSSCSDVLDLKPIDYSGANDFWNKPSRVKNYMDGLHINLRNLAWSRTVTLGELRGGIYLTGAGADGSALYNGDVISQNLSEDRPGIGSFGGFYGPIQNVNLLIEKLEGMEYPEAQKKVYLGQAYGLRALYYFDLYRTYGTVPLQLKPEVVNGVLDVEVIRKPRAAASEVLKQIKSDIAKSEELFGEAKGFDLYGVGGQKSAWSKAATLTLKGEVYLWSAKVATLDQPAQPQDITTAKEALKEVESGYNLSLLPNFGEVFDTKHKGNSEMILVSRLADGEATNNGVRLYLYRSNEGTVKELYKAPNEKFGDALDTRGNGGLFVQFKNELFKLFDDDDTRKLATFIPAYKDAAATQLEVAIPRKFIGEINPQGNRVLTCDIPHYRLADVYLMLAEIANMEGNNTDVELYVNKIRNRAYGSKAASHQYKAGDFKANELAILTERTKEFVLEGKRWYDLRRMQTAKSGGKALVFDADASIDATKTALLNEATEAYKVLWPIETNLHTQDSKILQTPGYPTQIK